jgi:hypothetical protein
LTAIALGLLQFAANSKYLSTLLVLEQGKQRKHAANHYNMHCKQQLHDNIGDYLPPSTNYLSSI